MRAITSKHTHTHTITHSIHAHDHSTAPVSRDLVKHMHAANAHARLLCSRRNIGFLVVVITPHSTLTGRATFASHGASVRRCTTHHTCTRSHITHLCARSVGWRDVRVVCDRLVDQRRQPASTTVTSECGSRSHAHTTPRAPAQRHIAVAALPLRHRYARQRRAVGDDELVRHIRQCMRTTTHITPPPSYTSPGDNSSMAALSSCQRAAHTRTRSHSRRQRAPACGDEIIHSSRAHKTCVAYLCLCCSHRRQACQRHQATVSTVCVRSHSAHHMHNKHT
jgi:hypothetical protein